MSTLNNNTMNTNNTTTASTPRKSFRFEPYQMNYSRVWLGSSPAMTSASNTAATNAHQANMSLSGASDDPMLSSSSLEESGALHALSITTPLHVCAAAPAPTGTESMSASSSIESEDADQQENDEDDTNNNYASDSDENENHHREDGEMPSAGAAATDSTANEEIEKPSKTAEAQRAPTRTMQHLLQTVPYLFLDTVALATAQSQDRARTHQTRVGDSVSAWSGSNASTLGSISGGGDIKDIFVAQLPFDMPLSALQELADLLITEEPRIQIVHAAPHYRKGRAYDGCAFLKMSEGDAHRFIDALHKRVLFDVDGVWVASTPQEIRELTDYCAWMQELRPDQRRQILHIPTPFSALTAEFALRATRGVTTTTNNNQPPFQHHAGMMMPHHHQHHHQLHHGVSQASSVMSTPPLGPAPASSADHTVADAPMLGGMMMPPAQPMFFASHASSSSSSSSYHQHSQHMMHQQPQRNMSYYAQHHSAQHAQHVMPISTAAATAAAFCDAVPMQPLHYNGPSSAQYYNQQQQYPGYANNYYNGYSAQRSHHGTF